MTDGPKRNMRSSRRRRLEIQKNMKNTITIHNKEYMPVSERIKLLYADKNNKEVSIETEILEHNPVLIRATVTTPRGRYVGHSAANPSKVIEKQNPYEVAETSAVGRALGFAGYGLTESVASADEMHKAAQNTPTTPPSGPATLKQVQMLNILIVQKGLKKEPIYETYKIESLKGLTKAQASTLIESLMKKANVEKYPKNEDVDPEEVEAHYEKSSPANTA